MSIKCRPDHFYEVHTHTCMPCDNICAPIYNTQQECGRLCPDYTTTVTPIRSGRVRPRANDAYDRSNSLWVEDVLLYVLCLMIIIITIILVVTFITYRRFGDKETGSRDTHYMPIQTEKPHKREIRPQSDDCEIASTDSGRGSSESEHSEAITENQHFTVVSVTSVSVHAANTERRTTPNRTSNVLNDTPESSAAQTEYTEPGYPSKERANYDGEMSSNQTYQKHVSLESRNSSSNNNINQVQAKFESGYKINDESDNDELLCTYGAPENPFVGYGDVVHEPNAMNIHNNGNIITTKAERTLMRCTNLETTPKKRIQESGNDAGNGLHNTPTGGSDIADTAQGRRNMASPSGSVDSSIGYVLRSDGARTQSPLIMLDDVDAQRLESFESFQLVFVSDRSMSSRNVGDDSRHPSDIYSFVSEAHSRHTSIKRLPGGLNERVANSIQLTSGLAFENIIAVYKIMDAKIHKFPWIVGCVISSECLEVFVDSTIDIQAASDQLLLEIPNDIQQYIQFTPEEQTSGRLQSIAAAT